MNRVFPFLSLGLIIVFVLSARNLYTSFGGWKTFHGINSIVLPFDPSPEPVIGYNNTESNISLKIGQFRKTEESHSLWITILSFVVTLLTGVVSFITALHTRKTGALPKSKAVYVAAIALTSSLLSFGQSQLGIQKDSATRKKAEVLEMRNEMELLAAEDVEKLKVKLPIFNRRLVEEY